MNHHISIKRRSGEYLQSFVKHGGRSNLGDRECKSSQFPKKNFGVFSKKPGKLILKSKKNYKNTCQRGFNAKEQSHSKYSLSSSLELYKLVNFSLYTVFSLEFKHVPITFSNYFLLSLQKIKKWVILGSFVQHCGCELLYKWIYYQKAFFCHKD